MAQGLLIRLNCLWRATATSAMVRSAMSVPTATIGAVRLASPIRASCTSTASMPILATPAEHMETLFVALRIKFYSNRIDGEQNALAHWIERF